MENENTEEKKNENLAVAPLSEELIAHRKKEKKALIRVKWWQWIIAAVVYFSVGLVLYILNNLNINFSVDAIIIYPLSVFILMLIFFSLNNALKLNVNEEYTQKFRSNNLYLTIATIILIFPIVVFAFIMFLIGSKTFTLKEVFENNEITLLVGLLSYYSACAFGIATVYINNRMHRLNDEIRSENIRNLEKQKNEYEEHRKAEERPFLYTTFSSDIKNINFNPGKNKNYIKLDYKNISNSLGNVTCVEKYNFSTKETARKNRFFVFKYIVNNLGAGNALNIIFYLNSHGVALFNNFFNLSDDYEIIFIIDTYKLKKLIEYQLKIKFEYHDKSSNGLYEQTQDMYFSFGNKNRIDGKYWLNHLNMSSPQEIITFDENREKYSNLLSEDEQF